MTNKVLGPDLDPDPDTVQGTVVPPNTMSDTGTAPRPATSLSMTPAAAMAPLTMSGMSATPATVRCAETPDFFYFKSVVIWGS